MTLNLDHAVIIKIKSIFWKQIQKITYREKLVKKITIQKRRRIEEKKNNSVT